MAIPKWLRELMVAEDAMRFAPRPSLSQIVGRAGGAPQPQSAEDFLRVLARDARRSEEMAAASVDRGYRRDENLFGLPVKTIEQGRSLGARNLPGIENLSPEDQIAVAAALDKGAMLRAMPAASDPVSLSSQLPDRVFADRGVNPWAPAPDASLGDVLRSMQNKRDYQRMGGLNPGLPPPAAFTRVPGGVVPSTSLNTLGDDVSDLASTLRQDQIDSRVLSIEELNDAARQAELDTAMRESADAVAADEAYARQYGGFPPDAVRGMGRGANRERMLRSGQLDRMTGDPLMELQRTELPAREDLSPIAPEGTGETFANQWAKTEGKDILKGFALGHVLSYPLMYGAYKMMQPGNEAQTSPFPPQGPARSIGADAALEDIPIFAAAQAKDDDIRDLIADIKIDAPDMPAATMPMDKIGVPDEPDMEMEILEDDVDGAPAADDLPPPVLAAMDAELRKRGLSGVPEWYMRAMDDPSVTRIDGRPKREAPIFSPQSLQHEIERQYRMAGMR